MKVFLAAGLSVLCAAPAFAAKDNFDRASLGKKWAIVDSTLSISNDQMVGSDLALGYFKKSSNDSTVSADISLNGSITQYGAVAIGDIAHGQNAFVKIQSNDGSTFVNGAFYVGDNGSGNFFELDAPVPSPATLEVSVCGTTAKMTIKSAAKTQKYSYDYGSSFGSGGGLGTYGAIALDNYVSKPSKNCTADADTTVIKGPGLIDPTKAK